MTTVWTLDPAVTNPGSQQKAATAACHFLPLCFHLVLPMNSRNAKRFHGALRTGERNNESHSRTRAVAYNWKSSVSHLAVVACVLSDIYAFAY
jgi:hypothetical protein